MAADGDAKVATDLAVDVARLRRTQQVARVGSWELDLTANTMWGADEAFRIYGLAKTPDNLMPFATQFRICRPADGLIRHIRSRAEVLRNAEGKPVLLTGTIQDVTELVEATMAVENALRANEERARLILEQAADAILLRDRKGNIIDANETACALTGYTRDELVALDVHILFTPASLAAKPLRFDLVDGGMNVINERILQRKDGGHVPIEMRSKRLSDNTLQSIIRDISERRRLEEQLQRRQRMDSLGTLAGGIVHDFNNSLTAFLGYADILRLSQTELAVEQRENV